MRVSPAHTGTSFFLTAVYASPTPSLCHQLWDSLINISSSIVDLCVIYGDFSVVLHTSERDSSSGRT